MAAHPLQFSKGGDFDVGRLRRGSRVPLRLAIKRVLAFLGAEMKFPSRILRVEVGLLLVHIHLANWIFGHEHPPGWRFKTRMPYSRRGLLVRSEEHDLSEAGVQL